MRASALAVSCCGLALFLCAFSLASGAPAVASLHTPLATPSARRADALGTIEYRVSGTGGALNLHAYTSGERGTARSTLYTFDDDATVGWVLASRMVRDLLTDRGLDEDTAQCQMRRDAQPKPLPTASNMAATLSKHTHELILECVDGNVALDARVEAWRFVQFQKADFHPNEVRAANQAHLLKTGTKQQYPLESTELIADSWLGLLGWVASFGLHHWGELHPYPSYTGTTQTGRWHLNTGAVLQRDDTFGDESDDEVRVAIAADWGAGTRESDFVQQVMMEGNGTAFQPHWTLHIGDIYYVGDPDSVKANCLGVPLPGVQQGVKWPHGSVGSLAVQGNHEMYSRGYGFFDYFLPTLGVTDWKSGKRSGQGSGHAALENAYWRVILLDTGYNTYHANILKGLDNKNNTLPPDSIEWLVNEVQIGNASDTRGIIFMMHHQVISAFYEPSDAAPRQLAPLMPANRTVIWIWGHEHKLAFYKQNTIQDVSNPVHYHGRCVGNSGFPSQIEPTPERARRSGLLAFDDRVYQLETGFFNQSVGYNGFTRLTLDKNVASLTYSTLMTDPDTGMLSPTLQTDLVREAFTVDGAGNVVLTDFAILNPDLTVVDNQ